MRLPTFKTYSESWGLIWTPMVDVMSTLLHFFLMTTTFLVVQPGFTVQPPQASAGRRSRLKI